MFALSLSFSIYAWQLTDPTGYTVKNYNSSMNNKLPKIEEYHELLSLSLSFSIYAWQLTDPTGYKVY